MPAVDAMEPWLGFADSFADLDAQEAESILFAWQGGVEKLGFLFQLPQQLALKSLGPEFAGFFDAYLGGDPPAPTRSEYFVQNLPAVRAAPRPEVTQELGALLGEAAVEHGWRWGKTDDHGLVVRLPSGFAFRPFALVRDLLGKKASIDVVLDVFSGLETMAA